MPKTRLPFLQLIQNDAGKNEFQTIDLPDQQGIVVLPQDSTTQQQIELLRRVILELGSVALRTIDPEPSRDLPTNIDCQVTVEERAQLFNFLHS